MGWEYKTIVVQTKGNWLGVSRLREEEIDRLLNDYGRSGWELATAAPACDANGDITAMCYTLKRPQG
jgi:hypothetical protein